MLSHRQDVILIYLHVASSRKKNWTRAISCWRELKHRGDKGTSILEPYFKSPRDITEINWHKQRTRSFFHGGGKFRLSMKHILSEAEVSTSNTSISPGRCVHYSIWSPRMLDLDDIIHSGYLPRSWRDVRRYPLSQDKISTSLFSI